MNRKHAMKIILNFFKNSPVVSANGFISRDLHFLNESYGIMVYEEQVSMVVMVMAGLGYAEAESLRKTMSRNSIQNLVLYWKKKFSLGALQRGYSSSLIVIGVLPVDKKFCHDIDLNFIILVLLYIDY